MPHSWKSLRNAWPVKFFKGLESCGDYDSYHIPFHVSILSKRLSDRSWRNTENYFLLWRFKNWSLVYLKCMNFRCTAKWFNYASASHSVVSNSLRPQDYTVHGILQARILELAAFPFSRGSSKSRDRTQISCIAGGFFTSGATREAQEYWSR